MKGWVKLVTGAVVGSLATMYATNEEFRNRLPQGVKDIPEGVRRRFEQAVNAGRDASQQRREEILRGLGDHDGHRPYAMQPEREE